MPLDLTYLPVSDGTGDAAKMTISADRASGSTTIAVDSVVGVPTKFIASSGTVGANGFMDPATITNFYGQLDGTNLQIDGFLPGSTDVGNTAGQVVVIKPNTFWANLVSELLNEYPGANIADGSISTVKVADGAITGPKAPTLLKISSSGDAGLGAQAKMQIYSSSAVPWNGIAAGTTQEHTVIFSDLTTCLTGIVIPMKGPAGSGSEFISWAIKERPTGNSITFLIRNNGSGPIYSNYWTVIGIGN